MIKFVRATFEMTAISHGFLIGLCISMGVAVTAGAYNALEESNANQGQSWLVAYAQEENDPCSRPGCSNDR